MRPSAPGVVVRSADGGKERGTGKTEMIPVSVEVHEGADTRLVRITATSIERAVRI